MTRCYDGLMERRLSSLGLWLALLGVLRLLLEWLLRRKGLLREWLLGLLHMLGLLLLGDLLLVRRLGQRQRPRLRLGCRRACLLLRILRILPRPATAWPGTPGDGVQGGVNNAREARHDIGVGGGLVLVPPETLEVLPGWPG